MCSHRLVEHCRREPSHAECFPGIRDLRAMSGPGPPRGRPGTGPALPAPPRSRSPQPELSGARRTPRRGRLTAPQRAEVLAPRDGPLTRIGHGSRSGRPPPTLSAHLPHPSLLPRQPPHRPIRSRPVRAAGGTAAGSLPAITGFPFHGRSGRTIGPFAASGPRDIRTGAPDAGPRRSARRKRPGRSPGDGEPVDGRPVGQGTHRASVCPKRSGPARRPGPGRRPSSGPASGHPAPPCRTPADFPASLHYGFEGHGSSRQHEAQRGKPHGGAVRRTAVRGTAAPDTEPHAGPWPGAGPEVRGATTVASVHRAVGRRAAPAAVPCRKPQDSLGDGR
jgi:hypothetical protein